MSFPQVTQDCLEASMACCMARRSPAWAWHPVVRQHAAAFAEGVADVLSGSVTLLRKFARLSGACHAMQVARVLEEPSEPSEVKWCSDMTV